jgi:hypothetical protein
MQKTMVINARAIAKGVVIALLVAGLAGYLSYQLGYHQAAEAGEKKRLTQAEVQGEQWRKNQLALDRMASDYNTACYNYQVLYDAYDQLYKKAGTGVAHIPRPDGAKGDDNSCYRES